MHREFAAFDMLGSDVGLWNTTLRDTMDKALDYGIDSVTVVDQIASTVSSHQSSASSAIATHLADMLLSNLDINDARDVPGDVLQLVNDTLVATYPPEPADNVTSIWLMRTLTRVLDACPVELSATVFELLQYGLALWISDEREAFTADEYTMDVSRGPSVLIRTLTDHYADSTRIPDDPAWHSVAATLFGNARVFGTATRERLLRPS